MDGIDAFISSSPRLQIYLSERQKLSIKRAMMIPSFLTIIYSCTELYQPASSKMASGYNTYGINDVDWYHTGGTWWISVFRSQQPQIPPPHISPLFNL